MKKKKDYGISMRFPSMYEKDFNRFDLSKSKEMKIPNINKEFLKTSKKELVINKDENTIIIIRKENIQEVKHQLKYTYNGFTTCGFPDLSKSFTPVYTEPESWYVIMNNGSKIDLTEKQYKIIKGWF